MKKNKKEVSMMVQTYRRWANDEARMFTYAKMVADNMEHLIMPGFKMEVGNRVRVIPYNKKFPPNVKQWTDQVAKIAKWMRKEPNTQINKEKVEADFYVYFPKRGTNIDVVVHSVNSEACEMEMVEEVVTVAKVTGYCAELKKRKYLVPA